MRALPYSAKWALTGGCKWSQPFRVCRIWRWIGLTLLNIDAVISCLDWLATCNSSLYVVNLSLIASNTKGHSAYTCTPCPLPTVGTDSREPLSRSQLARRSVLSRFAQAFCERSRKKTLTPPLRLLSPHRCSPSSTSSDTGALFLHTLDLNGPGS